MVVLATVDVSAPEDVVACTVVVGAEGIVEELSDVLGEVVTLELGPEEACSKVTVTLVGKLLDATPPVSDAVVVVMETADEISGPSDDDVEP